jgi:S-adenosyl-L-methionine hydrolase (adenosine-forming)
VAAPIITLTTDFGAASPYVAAMKGVILRINPAVQLVDLSHAIPPQNIAHAGFFLAGAVPYFPLSALHLVVVDPGVGSERSILCVDLGGHLLLGPDNGFWSPLQRRLMVEPIVHRVDDSRWQLPQVSNTFHGRDRMAPAIARLSLGLAPAALGPRTAQWCELLATGSDTRPGEIRGTIVFIDDFGNLITNITAAEVRTLGEPYEVEVGGKTLRGIMRTYSDVSVGTSLVLLSSFDLLEIAVCQGNAELLFSVGVGACVTLRGRASGN